ncbi:FAD-dependent monooxygenase [Streptacidiphilus sp. P02-A3a]|uniref:FAD-dependent monooxygenase n=1 Tax=Streptacidiphilus sp. P02-A3a TaxID=2704468 RepID=UPI0015FB08F5|nr:FAD-dependent monooxygenase [Streptacidiphilus sp. P02-A3a]QMU71552.1 monooxygenase [Streptacidiphilus sp. P02-A3a]
MILPSPQSPDPFDAAQSPVVIVGGGPVGLVLALLLDAQGVPSVVCDEGDSSFGHPRGNTHNARTMEHYRRLGIADQVRALGLPREHPTDVAYFTRYSGFELARLPMPSSREKSDLVASAPRLDQVPEPLHRANQMYVERFLVRHARTRPNISLRYGCRIEEVLPDPDGVTLRDSRGRVRRARYVVGCDGGRGVVRRSARIGYTGQRSLDQEILGGRATAAHLRLPTLRQKLLDGREAWSCWAVNKEVVVNLIALDGADEYSLLTSSVDPDAFDPGRLARIVRAAAGADLPVQVLGHRPWTAGVALVAESFGEGRMFLAGDAAHLFTPTGGFGMNTGIDDVANLAWKLAARMHGWGGARLLDSYGAERRPVALRNTGAARELNRNLADIARPAALDLDSAAGRAARAELGTRLAGLGEQFASVGVQLGARYDGSAIVVGEDSDDVPPDSLTRYTPSGVPGGRAPHLWLNGVRGHGSSLFDRLGPGFTLLRLGGSAPRADALRSAAADRGVPLTVLDVPDPAARELYGRDLALVRPDQHLAWRGDREPGDADALLGRLVGD